MRLVTYISERGARAGALNDSGSIVDAWEALGEPQGAAATAADPRAASGPTLRALLAAGRTEELAAQLGEAPEALATDEATLLAPIPDPEKIVCIGLNYRAHAEEAGLEPPSSPTIFAKYANALAAPGATVSLPAASAKVDFEAEVAFVIGREASNVAAGDALGHVAGYTLLNDLSARDLQFATPQWMAGKVFDGSAPCGPALVTPEEAGPPDAIEISLELNGEEMQRARTDDLIFGVGELVSELSRLMTLVPGDVVATGTPAGVGSTRKPRVWLAAGDEIVVRSPQLGELRTVLA